MKVVFIGADPEVADRVATTVQLRWRKTIPIVATTGDEGLQLVEELSPDIVILRPDFQDISLLDAITELRRFSNVPLIVLGYGQDTMEAAHALETGADDYVRIPFPLTEMVARISAILRRACTGTKENPLWSGALSINPATHEVSLSSQRIELNTREFRILYLLMRNWGTVLPFKNLARAIWGGTTYEGDLVRKYIQRLRRKLGDNARDPRWIVSVRGVGYRFVGPQPTSEPSEQISNDRSP